MIGMANRPNRPFDGEVTPAWDAHAQQWIAWARAPGFDIYWTFHRDLFLEIVPPPGRLTLDIGCGEGRLTADLARVGHRVVGIDASPRLIGAARAAHPELDLRVADAAALPLPDASADLAIAFMSLHDMDDAAGAIAEAGRVVGSGGRFCIALVHPLNSAGVFPDDGDPGAPLVIGGSYLAERRYVDDVERDGLPMTFTSIHRPIEAYTDMLASAGFVIERLREPAFPEHAVTRSSNRRWQRIPLFLHIRALRSGAPDQPGR